MPTVKPSITGSGTSAMKRPARTNAARPRGYPREKRGKEQPIVTELGDHARDDDDECAGGTADLDPAASQQRNQETAHDGGDEPRFRRRPGCDRDGNAQRQCNQRYRDSRQGVPKKEARGIILQRGYQLGPHSCALGGEGGAFNNRA